MGAAYSQDLRDRVIRAYQRGMPTSQIADVFQVSPAWARRVRQRMEQSGESSPRKTGTRAGSIIDHQRLAELVRQQPDATLKELRERLGVPCVDSTICKALKRLGLSFKKRRSTRPSRTGPTSRSVARRGGTTSPTSTRVV